jgi:hypothetical protein
MSKAICIHLESLPVDGVPMDDQFEAVAVYRHPGGGIFGVDESYVEQAWGPIRDPFNGRSVMIQENFTDPKVLAKMGRTEPFGIVYRWIGGDIGWSEREVTGADNLVARFE